MKKIYSILMCVSMWGVMQAQSGLVITEIMYSPPGAGGTGGIEYLEIYNNGSTNIDLTGYTINGSFNYSFPSVSLVSGDYFLLSNDSAAFFSTYGKMAYDYTGFILNSGSVIRIWDNVNQIVDSVEYENSAPWPTIANGKGPSLQLCDYNGNNNDPASWARSTNDLSIVLGNRRVYGTPGAANSCPTTPVVQLEYTAISVNENAGTVDLELYLDNATGLATSVDVSAISGTASATSDITFTSPTTVTFPAGFIGTQTVSVVIVDDTLDEADETLDFTLSNVTNGATLLNSATSMTIKKDINDNPVDRKMKLIGIADDASAGAARLIEVELLADVTDMSKYGLGCANNGGGTDGVEFNFPAIPGKKGDHYFVTNDSAAFHDFYGIAPSFISPGFNGAASYNGDDAMELFENGRVIDRYGLPDVDGTGEVWEYVDGWAHRRNNSGPDGDNFVPLNWEFSMNALGGATTNGEATKPYPLPKAPDPVDTTDSTVSVHQIERPKDLLIYPNPAKEWTLVKSTGSRLDHIKLYNSIGVLVLDTEVFAKEYKLNLGNLETGIYMIQLRTDDGHEQVRRIIKE
ncbi:MAG: lamin tail domain-containing protein [Flavobacteriales bacterium]|nr:lamin tail domain-containing protein [Flavobacteriales bacterium]